MSAHRVDLPLIPLEGWRAKAACPPRMKEMLWDDRVDDETDAQRDVRHGKAMDVCNRECLVREECGDKVDVKHDDGVRGGHLLPSLWAQHTPEESKLLELLRKGWTLDQAVRASRRLRRASKAS